MAVAAAVSVNSGNDHRGGAHRSGHHYLRSVAVLVGRELADQYKRPSSVNSAQAATAAGHGNVLDFIVRYCDDMKWILLGR